MRVASAVAIAWLWAGAAHAAAKAGTAHPKRQVLNFDKDTIAGDRARPDGELTAARRQTKLPPLLTARRDFRDRAVRGE